MGYFAYEKMLRAEAFGILNPAPGEEWVYPGLSVIPMGWDSAVGVIQEAIRCVTLTKAGLDLTQEGS